MMNDDPGLFALPDQGPPSPSERRPSGRARETWGRVVTADVTIVDPAAVREAVARRWRDVPEIARDVDAVAALLWPLHGLEELLDANAFRIRSIDVEAEEQSVSRGRITWAVAVKLADVRALRRIAVEAHPDQAGSIADSLAVAWTLAADPFAALHCIPGITWEPGAVDVRHLPRRPR